MHVGSEQSRFAQGGSPLLLDALGPLEAFVIVPLVPVGIDTVPLDAWVPEPPLPGRS
jgi:hypothetical protein